MSLHYLLDGYNIIHKLPRLLEGKLEDQRRGLIQFVERNQPQGSAKNQVTIVFDGQEDVWGGEEASSGIKVIFTSNQTADDKIKDIVEKSSNAKNFIVVSDDRAIQYAVRASGAKTLAVDEFLNAAKASSKKPKSNSKAISKEKESAINKELEDIWLKKDK